jgi:ATP-dependent DNA helicase RecG
MTYPVFHELCPDDDPLFMSPEDFQEAFPAESSFVEWKAGLGRGPIRETVTAFSNDQGGVILIGVDDQGGVIGQRLNPGSETTIHEAIGEVRDPGAYTISPLSVGEVPVVVVSVRRRREGFAQLSDGRVLTRRGARNVPLLGEDLQAFINQRVLGRYERTTTTARAGDIDGQLLDEVCTALGWSGSTDRRARLEELGLLVRDQLNVAGALLLLAQPTEVLEKAYIEVLRYQAEATEYDRRLEFRGPVQRQIEEASRFVAESVGEEIVVLGLRRHELPRLPLVVVREALANAVAHRSYETATAIRVELRPGEVIVSSPGRLPEPVTVENIRETQSARNPRVIRVLRALRLAEDAGRGIDVMQDEMKAELLEPPVFEESDHGVVVRLPIRSPVSPSERAWIRELEDQRRIDPADRVLLVHAARGERLSNARARELLGTEDALAARASLQRLRDAGLLVQHGARGGATYSLGHMSPPPAVIRITEEHLLQLVVDLAADGPVSNGDIREATGLDRVQALAVLSRLVREGRLARLGQRRGTRYVLPGSLMDSPARPSR